MTMPTTTREVERYLEEVRAALADLPEKDRVELLGDAVQHLTEVEAAEASTDLQERLGPPATYAAELRAAAGLPTRPEPVDTANARSLRGLVHETARGSRELLRDLRPAWWVARGALLAAVPFWLGVEADDNFPAPQPADSPVLGLLLVLTGIGLSVWLGRSADRNFWRRSGTATNVALIVLLAIATLTASPSGVESTFSVEQRQFLVSQHGPVTNVYPYDSEGRPLEGVLLFDQDGNPLRVNDRGFQAHECVRSAAHPTAVSGVVDFIYPIAYRTELDDRFPSNDQGRSRFEAFQRMMRERCASEVSRPAVSIPVFPPAPEPRPSPEAQP